MRRISLLDLGGMRPDSRRKHRTNKYSTKKKKNVDRQLDTLTRAALGGHCDAANRQPDAVSGLGASGRGH